MLVCVFLFFSDTSTTEIYTLSLHDALPIFTERPGGRSHWVVDGPLGTHVEWDAEVINEIENELIAWQSLPGGTVDSAGSDRKSTRLNSSHLGISYAVFCLKKKKKKKKKRKS